MYSLSTLRFLMQKCEGQFLSTCQLGYTYILTFLSLPVVSYLTHENCTNWKYWPSDVGHLWFTTEFIKNNASQKTIEDKLLWGYVFQKFSPPGLWKLFRKMLASLSFILFKQECFLEIKPWWFTIWHSRTTNLFTFSERGSFLKRIWLQRRK